MITDSELIAHASTRPPLRNGSTTDRIRSLYRVVRADGSDLYLWAEIGQARTIEAEYRRRILGEPNPDSSHGRVTACTLEDFL